MNTVPTENPQETTLLEALSPWLPWAVGAVVVVAITVWVLRRLHSGGQLVDLSSRAQRLLVKRATPSEAPKEPSPAIEGESPAWLTRALGAAAALPTLFALPWAAWAVAHVLPVPLYISLPLGVLFDLVMVASVVLALLVPSVSRQASTLGWAAAALASAAIMFHVGLSGALIFAATPLLSKALWGLLVTIRRAEIKARAEEKRQHEEAEREKERVEAERVKAEAEAARLAKAEQERKDAELSTELSHERKVELARLEEDAKYIEAKAERELRVDEAKAKAEHAKKVAEIERLGAEQRAMDEESAKVEIARQDLIRKVNASKPASFALSSGEVPNDLSGISSPAVASREEATDHLTLLGFGGTAPKPARATPLELEVRAREVYEPGMSLNAFRQALGVGMTKAHPLHQKLRAESEATG
ncbi:hypothetical protein ABZ234_03415 [Nocardiopsis sp. NPDC006198]|uniref:hypothetical protein n=1 Tax=Nocardiopsis sp. NPDC006198 TaxID=3154472 RepID=UPI0033A3E159